MNQNCQYGVYTTFSWDNVSVGAAVLQAEITGSTADWRKVTQLLESKGTNSDDFYFESEWGSARYNSGVQLTALVASKYPAAQVNYNNWAKGQMNYILGDNPANTCFVVGYADNSAKYPHHRGASGYSSSDEFNGKTEYSSNGHTLTGALVGGPTNSSGAYNDSVADYQANEVALDYNSVLVGAAAGLYSAFKTGETVDPSTIPEVKGNTSDPIYTGTKPITSTTTTTSNNGSVNTTTTTSAVKVEAGTYVITPNLSNSDFSDNMPGWKWSDFNIPDGETASRVEVRISSDSTIGTWNGAFGTMTGDEWHQVDFNEYFNSNEATAVWNVAPDRAEMIDYNMAI